MRFLLGFLLGYYIRGKKHLLVGTVATLTSVVVFCSIVLPAIALSQLALSVRRERLSRPPQTSVPVIVGLNYKTAQIKLRDTATYRADSTDSCSHPISAQLSSGY
jgi:hypothetical protein